LIYLSALIAHRDRVISRQELLEHLWPQQFVSEATLNSCIMEARQAVGDTGQAQRLIQTLHGRGYRFVAAVEEASASPPAEEARALLAPRRVAAAGMAASPTTTPVTSALADLGHAVAHTPVREAHALTEGSDLSPDVLEGERKHVTILCCALADVRGIAVHLGAEAMYRLMQAFLALAQHVIQRYAGTLMQRLSDGFVAFFGAPVAQEDHARQAVLAALEVQQRVRTAPALRAPLRGASLATSMGLHTGMVIVGPLGEDAQTLYAALDDTTDVASRLQRLAGPDTIVMSEATRRLVQEEVRVEACDAAHLAALPQPLPIYRVREIIVRRSGVTGRGGRLLSPFVGRERELASLLALLAQVEAGQGQVVGIVGEPGIGKSRLLDEWARALRERGVGYLAGHCFAYEQATPYGPVRGMLRQLCGMTDADSPAAMAIKLRQCLREVGLTPDADAPYLLALLGVPEDTAAWAGISPEVRKARTLALLRHLSLHSQQGQPRVIAVENVHWIDPTSEEYLTRLADSLAGAKLLVVTTYRPGYRPPWLDKSYATQLTLPRLRPQDSRAVVQAVLASTPDAGPWEQAILATADGNPFFLEELAWAVREGGVAQPTALLPDTVHAVLAARMDRLPPVEKRLLQTAAVIGHDIPLPVFQAIAELPEVELYGALAHLQAAEFLYETRLFPERAYTFKHALTHEVAYGGLLQERRRVLHARIVAALEALTEDRVVEQVERLAHHALRGAVWDKALAYCRQAGEKAIARSAYREAGGYFEQALRALPQRPEHGEALEQSIDLRLALRYALLPLGEYDRIAATLREAATLATVLDDQRRLCQVQTSMTHYCWITGDLDRALLVGQRALALATPLHEVDLYTQAHFYVAEVYYSLGQYSQAITALQCNAEALLGDDRRRLSRLSVASLRWLTIALAEVGAFVEGLAWGETAIRSAEAIEQPYTLANTYMGLSHLYVRKGDFPQALPLLSRSLALCQTWDLAQLVTWRTGDLGYALALSGRISEGLTLVEQALQQATSQPPHQLSRNTSLAMLASETYLLASRLEEAHTLAERTLALTRTYQERGHEAYALRLLGEIAAHGVPPQAERAETHYHQALALAEELGMRPLQAHCHRGLGTLYATTDQREQARAALSTAIEMYRAMEMTFWLPQTEAGLAQVERKN
jgi:class 3 adenylate cyclase/tetratricopeptide (TPR) repeat protein